MGTRILNPPFGRGIGAWMHKAADEVASGNAALVVCLVPAKVDTAWFREAAGSAASVRFVPSRIHFSDGDRAPFPCAIVTFSRHEPGPWCPYCSRPAALN